MIAPLALLLLLPQPTQQPGPPLPSIETHKADVWRIANALLVAGDNVQKKDAPFDDGELQQYTYTEKETRVKLNSKGQPKETETTLYQVTRGPEAWQFYRKRLSTNGVPVSASELAKQDREQKKREEKQRDEIDRAIREEQKSAAKSKSGPAPTLTREEGDKLRDDTLFEYFSSIYDIRIAGREVIDGHATVLITFQPKANAKTRDDLLKMLKHIAIRGWVREQSHELVRMEADVIDTISFGFGLLARFQKGSVLRLERRPINNEIWAPVKVEATINARVLVLKGISERQTSEFSDFKKYTVETVLRVVEPDKPAQ